MISTCIKGGIVGGIILFIWMCISWMLLPWHVNTFNAFQNETAVTDVVKTNASKSGIYMLPSMQTDMEKAKEYQGPTVFSSVKLDAPRSMTMNMGMELVKFIVMAFFMTWLLTKTAGLSYVGRVGFVLGAVLAVGLSTNIAYWTWFAFDTQYTLVSIADEFIGWFLAGLVLAKITRRR